MKHQSPKWKLAQTLELAWWKRYLGGQDTDEYLSWKRTYWNRLLEHLPPGIPIRDPLEILDAGCGPAGVFIVLDRSRVDAVDPLLDQYEKSFPHFQRAMYPYVNFTSSPLEDFPLQKKYDIVFCMNAINHVSDLPAVLNKIVDAVKPGAHLIATIDAHNHTLFKHFLRMIPGDVLHPHQFDLEEYLTMLSSRDLTLIKTHLLKNELFFNHYLLIFQKPVPSVQRLHP